MIPVFYIILNQYTITYIKQHSRILKTRLISLFAEEEITVDWFAAHRHNPRRFLPNYVWHELRFRLQLHSEAHPRSSHYPGEWILFSQRLALPHAFDFSIRDRETKPLHKYVKGFLLHLRKYFIIFCSQIFFFSQILISNYLYRIVGYDRNLVANFIKIRSYSILQELFFLRLRNISVSPYNL